MSGLAKWAGKTIARGALWLLLLPMFVLIGFLSLGRAVEWLYDHNR